MKPHNLVTSIKTGSKTHVKEQLRGGVSKTLLSIDPLIGLPQRWVLDGVQSKWRQHG
jgi:hypothetical protein